MAGAPCLVWPRWLLGLFFIAILVIAVVDAGNDGNWTVKHEAGRCALKGQCGKQSIFGGELPCPDNSLADTPAKDVREKLVGLCGETWKDSDVCCDKDQVRRQTSTDGHGAHTYNGLAGCFEHQP